MDIFWGSAAIFIFCPILGGLPLIDWITRGLTGKKLATVGTGNVSVSAAFYHGGTVVGILSAVSEASKGIGAVAIARYFFPGRPTWQLIALIALIMGRYWMGKGAGATNAFWGIVFHDPVAAAFIVLIGGTSFTIFRHRATGRLVGLGVLAFVLTLRRPNNNDYILAAIALAVLLAWIYHKIPDDLDLPEAKANTGSQKVFRFFRGDNALLTLSDRLDPLKVGRKAANLSLLKRWEYNVPEGWVLPAGDDPQPLILSVSPSPQNPLIVRSSALGEDSETASAAGQYLTIGNITDAVALEAAMIRCQTAYNNPAAQTYRRDRQQEETALAIIVQQQIAGVFSGVAFSRDPMDPTNEAVIVEALPGGAAQVVSGQATPEQYRVYLEVRSPNADATAAQILIEGEGNTPSGLIQEVGQIVRDLENRFHGIPQDIEWTYDGETLWLLQMRPITTLIPLWTRKIAAEVIPGAIPPLTWSINRPLTCGVWGDIFTIVLGKRDRDLDFTETATLHYSHAYFNATLLGEIFRRMGLPPESLEFLTRGAKFSKPPLISTLKNVPGLLGLLGREWSLKKDFDRDYQKWFSSALSPLNAPAESLDEEELLARIDSILSTLERATYYSILAPLSAAIRQAIFQVSERYLDNSQLPEVESLRSLAELARKTRNLLPLSRFNFDSCPSLFTYLAETPDCESSLQQFKEWLEEYGYLSQVATDISVPRWREDPRPMRELFTQYIFHEPRRQQGKKNNSYGDRVQGLRTRIVQQRWNLKGRVSEVYSRLLAKLRRTFLALEKRWLDAEILAESGDIFLLKLEEIRGVIEDEDLELRSRFPDLVKHRRSQWEKNKKLSQVPYIVYGQTREEDVPILSNLPPKQQLTGIPASSGIVEGRIKVVRSLIDNREINEETVLVVPYTDAGWSPLLSRAKGIIAEVGGKLSHGAILAREYGIPAIMDVNNAMQYLRDGQLVRLDGQKGIIEILE